MTDRPTPTRRRPRRPFVLAGLLALAAVAAFVLVWFQPQKLFIDDEVDEALPGLVVAGAPAEAPMVDEVITTPDSSTASPTDTATPGSRLPDTATPDSRPPDTSAPALPANSLERAATEAASLGTPVAAGTGSFVSLEHATSGEALIVVQPDGSRLLRLEALDTDNGPDLRVVLSPSAPGSGTYDGLVELGRLKGNKGSQNYEIPAELDLTAVGSVVIWCERFSAPFGEAPVQVVA